MGPGVAEVAPPGVGPGVAAANSVHLPSKISMLDILLDGRSVKQVCERTHHNHRKLQEIAAAEQFIPLGLPKETVHKLNSGKKMYTKEINHLNHIIQLVIDIQEAGGTIPEHCNLGSKPNYKWWDDDEDFMGGSGVAGTNIDIL